MFKGVIAKTVTSLLIVLSLALLAFAQATPEKQHRGTRAKRAAAVSDLDLLSRAEQRAETMRARLVDLQSKEADLKARIDDLDERMKPENIQRALAFVGSVRPMDELRDALRVRLEGETARANEALQLLQSNRIRLETAISETDTEIERLRQRVNSQQ
jgi:uncharacterized protein YlxW (UPF0749 family)